MIYSLFWINSRTSKKSKVNLNRILQGYRIFSISELYLHDHTSKDPTLIFDTIKFNVEKLSSEVARLIHFYDWTH